MTNLGGQFGVGDRPQKQKVDCDYLRRRENRKESNITITCSLSILRKKTAPEGTTATKIKSTYLTMTDCGKAEIAIPSKRAAQITASAHSFQLRGRLLLQLAFKLRVEVCSVLDTSQLRGSLIRMHSA